MKGREVGREVAALAREVARQSQAPTRPRFTLVMFTLHVNHTTWETFVSPDEVAELTEQHRGTIYDHVALLEELGELVPAGKHGRSVLRRVLPGRDVSPQGRHIRGAEVSASSRLSVGHVSPQGRHEVEVGSRKTPSLLDSFAISELRPPVGAGPGQDQAPVEGGGDPTDAGTSWSRLLEHVRGELTDYAFHVWIDPLVPVALEAGVLRLWAPRHIHALVRDRYRPVLTAAARTELGDEINVDVVTDPRDPEPRSPNRKRRKRAAAREAKS